VSRIKIEVFYSTAHDSKDTSMTKLINEIAQEFGDKVEIATYKGYNERFNGYYLTATPAVVIEEMVKIMGFCPSKETLVCALKEAGVV
jgi:hypothetical protein